jgi:hypothetical protein
MKIFKLITVLLFLSFAGCSYADSEKFISIADIHFDPYFDCHRLQGQCDLIVKLNKAPYQEWEAILEKYSSQKLSGTGSDTNYALLKLSLERLQQLNKELKPSFVFVLGDFLAHGYRKKYKIFSGDPNKSKYADFVRKSLQFLTYELRKSFPDTEIYPVVGNNDSYTSDYGCIPDGKFFSDIEAVWSKCFINPNNLSAFQRRFSTAGYYAVDAGEDKKLRLIILNSVLFSGKSRGPNLNKAAQEEFRWLRSELQNATHKKQAVYILYHIPPGVDVFATLRLRFNFIKLFWRKEYGEQFAKILSEYPGTVKAIFPAHIHLDAIQLLTVGHSSITEYFTPSISPIFGNAPSYKVFISGKDYKIESYDTFNVD